MPWVDADTLLTIIRRFSPRPPRFNSTPLNYTDAAELARLCGFKCEHQSDGTTRILVEETPP